jgi:hypothetical protein
LSYNAKILRQNIMLRAGRTQTAGRTAATAGYLGFSKWQPPMARTTTTQLYLESDICVKA